jgi:two-component system, NtrC family, response regulator HydG
MKRTHLPRVLVVDDNAEMAHTLCEGLADHGYDAVPMASGLEAIALLGRDSFDAVVTDLRMPGADGLQVLAASREQRADRPVIVMTAFSALDTAIESIRRGAYHYLTKPFKTEELVIFLGRALDEFRVRREAASLRSTLREHYAPGNLLGTSRAWRSVIDVIERVADSPLPVLIVGETGTGKGVVARAIHAAGARSGRAFVTVNCAALPEALLESELFGHLKGAFTGATAARPGLFTEASGGTLFLDEIGDMPLPLQAKLLHVIESGTVRPVGAEKEHAVDVRLLAASHHDLREAVRGARFREDLLYRLDVVTVELPPLRQRREDVLALAEHFLRAARASHPASPVERLSPEVVDRLRAHSWPGNVRELQHAVERLVVLGRGVEAQVADLPAFVSAAARDGDPTFHGEVVPVRDLNRRYAAWALDQLGGHKGRTAEALGIDGKTLAKWLSESEPAGS